MTYTDAPGPQSFRRSNWLSLIVTSRFISYGFTSGMLLRRRLFQDFTFVSNNCGRSFGSSQLQSAAWKGCTGSNVIRRQCCELLAKYSAIAPSKLLIFVSCFQVCEGSIAASCRHPSPKVRHCLLN